MPHALDYIVTRFGAPYPRDGGTLEADSLTPDDIAAHRIYITLCGPQPPINVLGRLIPSTQSLEAADSPDTAHYRKRQARLRVRRQLELLALLTGNQSLQLAIAGRAPQKRP